MKREILGQILIVEDSTSTALVYSNYLKDDYLVKVVHSGKDALAILKESSFDIILLDICLPDISGIKILHGLRQINDETPVILMTAHGSVDIAVDAMRQGASDFLTKPFDRTRLCVTVSNTLKGRRLSDIVNEYEKNCLRKHFHRLIGGALTMQSVYRIVESAASSSATIFITGESGTGKELCAEAIHLESNRSCKPYVALNCAAIPRDLLESEIFGHVKGAFTGASTAREGAASRASGGSLFLDEIGEMPLDLQSKLLRFIQSGTFQPVGSSREVKVDIRFICATNRDPLQEVRAGRFREDLYYRLHVIPISMPPLRERGKDCLLIAKELLVQFNQEERKNFLGFSSEVEKTFLKYEWPGNVRELSNVIRNVVVLNKSKTITLDMLPKYFNKYDSVEKENFSGLHQSVTTCDQVDALLRDVSTNKVNEYKQNNKFYLDSGDLALQQSSPPSDKLNSQSILPLWIEEKRIIERAIDRCDGNVPRAAAFLEISPSTIYRKKQQWDKAC